MRLIKTVGVSVMVVALAGAAFGTASFDWYTSVTATDGILYPTDGNPGVGDKSIETITGALGWYTMIYDTSALDVSTFDVSSYASTSDARDAVMAAELIGGNNLQEFSASGTYYSYIDEEGVVGTAVTLKTIGTIAFNVPDPTVTDLSGMMFAYSTQNKIMPDMNDSPEPAGVIYDAGVIGFDGAEWKAVPEPVSAMIAFLGVPVLVLARRRFNKK